MYSLPHFQLNATQGKLSHFTCAVCALELLWRPLQWKVRSPAVYSSCQDSRWMMSDVLLEQVPKLRRVNLRKVSSFMCPPISATMKVCIPLILSALWVKNETWNCVPMQTSFNKFVNQSISYTVRRTEYTVVIVFAKSRLLCRHYGLLRFSCI